MRIFVTGATGYIGTAVVEALVRGGHLVTGLVRNTEKAGQLSALGAAALVGDLARPETYRDAVASHEAVIHAANANSHETPAIDRLAIDTVLACARQAGGSRVFVYTSGIWVLGQSTTPMTEEAPRDPTPLSAWRAPHEDLVLGAGGDGLRTVVVRPGIVYGGRRGIVGDLFKDAVNGLVRVVGNGENHWPAIYDRDLADLYLRLANHPEAHGIYHATDGADERVSDIVDAIVGQVSHPAAVRHMPLKEAKAKMGDYAVALALDQVVHSPRARALGWSPSLHGISRNVARLFEEWRAASAV
jgi:nucleoside-diphosphate-sugar epimerase